MYRRYRCHVNIQYTTRSSNKPDKRFILFTKVLLTHNDNDGNRATLLIPLPWDAHWASMKAGLSAGA